MDFKEANRYLGSLISYENFPKIPYQNFNLERFKDFLREFVPNFDKLKYLQVAGSKGKGSTCSLLADYLLDCGYKVGLFTSPHIIDVTERISFSGKNIGKARFADYVMDVKNLLAGCVDYKPTYFEALTAIALKYFVDERADYVVLEVGLGGRLDATSAVVPKLAILTTVEKEHSDVLGKTLKKILNEKLAIKKDGVPLVVGFQNKYVRSLIRRKMRKEFYFAQELKKSAEINFLMSLKIIDEARFKNAVTAFYALKILFGEEGSKVDKAIFAKVVKNFKLLGRFDLRKIHGKDVVFDMAHTKNSMQNLCKNLRKVFPGKKFVFLVALLKGKEVRSILKVILKVAKKIVFTKAHEERGIEPEKLMMSMKDIDSRFPSCGANAPPQAGKAYGRHGPSRGGQWQGCGNDRMKRGNDKCSAEVKKDALEAFKSLRKGNFAKQNFCLKKSEVLVVTGSHFLLAKIFAKMNLS